MLKRIKRLKFKLKINNYLPKLANKLKNILAKSNNIPVIIVSYNNFSYVQNMVRQLHRLGIIGIVIDNNSTDEVKRKLKFLQEQNLANVIFSNFNFGHKVGFYEPIYQALPEVFAYTDPDLSFNENLPKDFLEQFLQLSEKYQVYKVGMALALQVENYKIREDLIYTNTEQRKPFRYPAKKFTPNEWEMQWWRFLVKDEKYQLYAAKIDTTFALYNKKFYKYDFGDALRVAGDFSAIHLPWFAELDLMHQKEKQNYQQKNNQSSSWK